MDDDSRVIDKGWDALPEYASKSGDADDAVTVSISTTPGEWLVNTVDSVVVPMSMHELVEALQSHKLTDRSLVWRAGMPEWASVERVPQLRLAARMPMHVAPVPPRPTPAAGAAPSKPPPNPVRATPAPHPVPPTAPTAHALPSRRSTLPFGSTAPLGPGSRPAHSRPSQPRVAAPSTASKEEPEVLAVYERPAATISFDLSPVPPVRAVPSVPPAPQTLAPTTTDSPQRALRPTNADLSVVAASDFRQVQRSSKRLVVVSSLASAAAASLLTFALSRGGASRPTSAAAQGEGLPAAPAMIAPPAPASAASAPSAAPAADATLAPTPSSEATAGVPAVKPKSKPRPVRRAKAVTAVAVPRPARTETDDATRDPSSEPNPYSVKLDEDAPAAKPTPAVHGSGLEPDTAPDASTSSSASPGF